MAGDLSPFDDDDPPSFPLAANLAGYTWVALGCLGVLASLALLIWAFTPDGACAVVVLTAVGATLGGIFVYSGWTMTLGRPKDTLRFSLWSLGFSFFVFGIAAVLVVSLLEFGPFAPPVITRVAASAGGFFTIGLLFAVAGVLAISSRGAYRRWRAYYRPPSKPRRPRYGNYDDDGRPRHPDWDEEPEGH